MEHWEPLSPGGLRFAWDDALFRPGTDSFLLSSLPRLKPGLRVIDLGCGTGLLSLLLLQRQGELSVTGLDLQPEAVALGRRAAEANGLTGRLDFRLGDLRDIRALFPTASFDLAVCNPPYYSPRRGAVPEEGPRRAARSESSCTLEDVFRAAAYLLRWGGRLCLVQKPERLTDLLCAARANALEPKRLRFACRRAGAAASLVLLEARRGGRPGLAVEPPLVLEDGRGRPTAELDSIYFREREDAL